jgi:hypothetical protein
MCGNSDLTHLRYFQSSPKLANFVPIPKLVRSDAMVTVVFLGHSGILYMNKTDDPWMRADKPANSSGAPIDLYSAGGEFGVMGCMTERYFCNPDLGLDRADCFNNFGPTYDIEKYWPDPEDEAVMRPLMDYLNYGAAGMSDDMYAANDASVMLSAKTISSSSNVQLDALPSNQWQLERIYNYESGMAALQSVAVEYARGLWFRSSGIYCNDTSSHRCERLCRSQVCGVCTSSILDGRG